MDFLKEGIGANASTIKAIVWDLGPQRDQGWKDVEQGLDTKPCADMDCECYDIHPEAEWRERKVEPGGEAYSLLVSVTHKNLGLSMARGGSWYK